MGTLPPVKKSPLGVWRAIEAYCCLDGQLDIIADALGLEINDFTQHMEWYLCNMREPFSDEKPEPQVMLNLILIQSMMSTRKLLCDLENRLSALEKTTRRINTPYRY